MLNIILRNFLPTLGHDLKITCAKFQGNRFIIDGKIDEKHALLNYQNECVPGYRLYYRNHFKKTHDMQGFTKNDPPRLFAGVAKLYNNVYNTIQ